MSHPRTGRQPVHTIAMAAPDWERFEALRASLKPPKGKHRLARGALVVWLLKRESTLERVKRELDAAIEGGDDGLNVRTAAILVGCRHDGPEWADAAKRVG